MWLWFKSLLKLKRFSYRWFQWCLWLSIFVTSQISITLLVVISSWWSLRSMTWLIKLLRDWITWFIIILRFSVSLSWWFMCMQHTQIKKYSWRTLWTDETNLLMSDSLFTMRAQSMMIFWRLCQFTLCWFFTELQHALHLTWRTLVSVCMTCL